MVAVAVAEVAVEVARRGGGADRSQQQDRHSDRHNVSAARPSAIAHRSVAKQHRDRHVGYAAERYYDVPLSTRVNYGLYYLGLAAFLGIMSYETHLLLPSGRG